MPKLHKHDGCSLGIHNCSISYNQGCLAAVAGVKVQGSKHLFGVSEAVYEFDFLHKVPSNVSNLLAQIVLCEGVICWQPEAHILIAGWVPAQKEGLMTSSLQNA